MPCAPSLTPASLGPQLPTQGLSHHQIFPCPQLDPAGLTSACHTCGQGPRLPQTCSSTWMCSGRGRMGLLRTTLGAAPTPPSNRLLLGAITSQPHQPSASPSLGPPTPGAARGPRPRSDHTSAWPRSAEAPQPGRPPSPPPRTPLALLSSHLPASSPAPSPASAVVPTPLLSRRGCSRLHVTHSLPRQQDSFTETPPQATQALPQPRFSACFLVLGQAPPGLLPPLLETAQAPRPGGCEFLGARGAPLAPQQPRYQALAPVALLRKCYHAQEPAASWPNTITCVPCPLLP